MPRRDSAADRRAPTRRRRGARRAACPRTGRRAAPARRRTPRPRSRPRRRTGRAGRACRTGSPRRTAASVPVTNVRSRGMASDGTGHGTPPGRSRDRAARQEPATGRARERSGELGRATRGTLPRMSEESELRATSDSMLDDARPPPRPRVAEAAGGRRHRDLRAARVGGARASRGWRSAGRSSSCARRTRPSRDDGRRRATSRSARCPHAGSTSCSRSGARRR